jgi:hypothetical protein
LTAVSAGPTVGRMRTTLAAGIVLALCATTVIGTAAPSVAAAACKGTAPSDFNGDGISDVAIGEPHVGAGLVHVLYGTRSGLHADASGTAPNDQLIHNIVPTGSGFGTVVTTLDFNGDGCSDLAVGVPVSVIPDAVGPAGVRPAAMAVPGYVAVFFGSPAGLVTSSQEDISESNASVTPGARDEFGFAVAGGDLNNDGKDDLVVGAPGRTAAGAAFVFPGTNGSVSGYQFAPGDGVVPTGDGGVDQFGAAVATGDFNGDGRDDVAVGAPGFASTGGIVDVMNGSGTAPFLVGGVAWSQDTPGVSGTSEPGDRFGAALATGDFRGDGHTDLAVGVPGEAIGTVAGAGQVNVLYSIASSGLTAAGNQGWNQNSTGISGTSEAFDHFGAALAVGDFNGNGRDDLAIGVPGEGVVSPEGDGQVNVLMGGSGVGLSSSGQKAWNQNTTGISGTPEPGDQFGAALTAIRVRSGGRNDLVVGVPGEGLGSVSGAGEIQLIPGSSSGLTATNSQTFSDNTSGLQGTATAGGRFGTSLA